MSVEQTNDPDVLQRWVGNTQSSVDALDVQWCQQLDDALDRHGDLQPGAPMPPLRHWLTHRRWVRSDELGPDGHPRRGTFLPPVALPRRMWAGSRVEIAREPLLGDGLIKASTVTSVKIKDGRSGPLCFVTLVHEYSTHGAASANELAIRETQDLVYRDDPRRDTPAPASQRAPETYTWERTFTPTSLLLFRYSALTYNTHRIHYDVDYARGVEGYEGLVVHGPLLAMLLADLAVDQSGRALRNFEFRGVAPTIADRSYVIQGAPNEDGSADLWVADQDGALKMTATAEFAPEIAG